jgi:hypothetical protein
LIIQIPLMKINILLIVLAACAIHPWAVAAQDDTTSLNTSSAPAQPKTQQKQAKPSFADRLAFGGNIGLSFGTVTYIEIAPLVGYRVTDAFTTGLGFRYIYYKDNYYDYTSNIYGGTVFARYRIFKGLFAEADFEANNLDAYTPDNSGGYTLERKWIPSLLLGGGYSSSIGRSAGFFISILYDVLQDPNSPYYGQPVIRAGVGFGI